MNNMKQEYISDLLVEYKPSRALRSLGSSHLLEPHVKSKQGQNAFSHYFVHRWNKRPVDFQCSPTLDTFEVKLKAQFSQAVI